MLREPANRGEMALNTNAQSSQSLQKSPDTLFVFVVFGCVCARISAVFAWMHITYPCVLECVRGVCCSVPTHIPSGSKPCPSCAKINPPWEVEDLAQSAECYTF